MAKMPIIPNDFAFVGEGISTFTGEDVTYTSTKWAQDIEDNAEIFEWTAQQKLIIARRSLAGTAALWLRSEKPFKNFEDLKTALIKEFPDSVNSKEMHEIMSKRKKRKDESCYQYMLIMKELGKRAKFPDYVAIQYIIDGISDYETNKMILYGVTSYAVLKEKLSIYESIKGKNVRRHEYDSRQLHNSEKHLKPATVPIERCYKCGERNHKADMCKNGVKCFKCNKFGHIGRFCNELSEPEDHSKSIRKVNVTQINHSTNDRENDVERKNDYDDRCTNQSLSVSVSRSMSEENYKNNSQFLSEDSVKLNKSVKEIKMGNVQCKCLVDTGSDINIVSQELFSKLNCSFVDDEKLTLVGLGASKVHSIGKLYSSFEIDGHVYHSYFHVVPHGVIPCSVILGQPFLAAATIIIDKGVVKILPDSHDSSYLMSNSIDWNPLTVNNQDVQNLINNNKPLKVKDSPIKMQHVDSLSRNVGIIQTGLITQIGQAQVEDKTIRPIRDNFLDKSVTYKSVEKTFVVPELMDLQIIKTAHSVSHFDKTKRKYFVENRKKFRKEVKVQIFKMQEENRKNYNKRRKAGYSYKEGDLVAIQRTQFGTNLKLKSKFFGPYRIINKLGKDRYEVQKVNSASEGPKRTTTAVDFMKRWSNDLTMV